MSGSAQVFCVTLPGSSSAAANNQADQPARTSTRLPAFSCTASRLRGCACSSSTSEAVAASGCASAGSGALPQGSAGAEAIPSGAEARACAAARASSFVSGGAAALLGKAVARSPKAQRRERHRLTTGREGGAVDPRRGGPRPQACCVLWTGLRGAGQSPRVTPLTVPCCREAPRCC